MQTTNSSKWYKRKNNCLTASLILQNGRSFGDNALEINSSVLLTRNIPKQRNKIKLNFSNSRSILQSKANQIDQINNSSIQKRSSKTKVIRLDTDLKESFLCNEDVFPSLIVKEKAKKKLFIDTKNINSNKVIPTHYSTTNKSSSFCLPLKKDKKAVGIVNTTRHDNRRMLIDFGMKDSINIHKERIITQHSNAQKTLSESVKPENKLTTTKRRIMPTHSRKDSLPIFTSKESPQVRALKNNASKTRKSILKRSKSMICKKVTIQEQENKQHVVSKWIGRYDHSESKSSDQSRKSRTLIEQTSKESFDMIEDIVNKEIPATRKSENWKFQGNYKTNNDKENPVKRGKSQVRRMRLDDFKIVF